jgi:long-chain fatty acid transport protein
LLEQSASSLGTAFAGTAAAGVDATTIFFNPAGMTRLSGTQLSLVNSGVDITSRFHNGGSTAAFGQPSGSGGGNAGDWNFVPSVYLSKTLGPRLALGLGINAPFGLQTDYDDAWVGRFQALHSEIKTMNVNPALAFRLTERLSLGVGIDYQRLQAELTNAVDYSAVVAQGVQQLVAAQRLPPQAVPGILSGSTALEGRARVRGDDTGWGFNVGLLWDLSQYTHLGLSYRSEIAYDVRGTARFTSPEASNAVAAGIIAQASAAGAALANGAVSVDLTVPDSAVLSLQQAVGERAHLLVDVAWTGWSSVQELRVVRDSGTTVSVTPERWHDTWRYAVGATYEVRGGITLRAGVAHDQTPVPDATRTPRLPDSDRIWTAFGARWDRGPLTVDFGYAHLFGDTVPMDQNGGNAVAAGVLRGKQVADVEVMGLQFAFRWQ